MKKILLTCLALMTMTVSMAKNFQPEHFQVEDPVMQIMNGKFYNAVNINIPPKFFGKKAVMSFTPVFRWKKQEVRGETVMLQGEKAESNCRIVGYKYGASVKATFTAGYERGMEEGKFYMLCEELKNDKVAKSYLVELEVAFDEVQMLVFETVKDANFVSFTAGDGKTLADNLFRQSEGETNVNQRIGKLDQAILYTPDNYKLHNNLALCYMEKGDVDMAKKEFEKARAINPESPELAANFALMSLLQGDVDAAKRYLATAEGAPNYDEIAGNLYVIQGDYAYATARMQNLHTNSAILAHILNQELAKAKTIMDEKKDPNDMTNLLKVVLGKQLKNDNLMTDGLSRLQTQGSPLYAKAKKIMEKIEE